jgi:hypothetical protein
LPVLGSSQDNVEPDARLRDIAQIEDADRRAAMTAMPPSMCGGPNVEQ